MDSSLPRPSGLPRLSRLPKVAAPTTAAPKDTPASLHPPQLPKPHSLLTPSQDRLPRLSANNTSQSLLRKPSPSPMSTATPSTTKRTSILPKSLATPASASTSNTNTNNRSSRLQQPKTSTSARSSSLAPPSPTKSNVDRLSIATTPVPRKSISNQTLGASLEVDTSDLFSRYSVPIGNDIDVDDEVPEPTTPISITNLPLNDSSPTPSSRLPLSPTASHPSLSDDGRPLSRGSGSGNTSPIDVETPDPRSKKLSERTMATLEQLAASPGMARRTSFFNTSTHGTRPPSRVGSTPSRPSSRSSVRKDSNVSVDGPSHSLSGKRSISGFRSQLETINSAPRPPPLSTPTKTPQHASSRTSLLDDQAPSASTEDHIFNSVQFPTSPTPSRTTARRSFLPEKGTSSIPTPAPFSSTPSVNTSSSTTSLSFRPRSQDGRRSESTTKPSLRPKQSLQSLSSLRAPTNFSRTKPTTAHSTSSTTDTPSTTSAISSYSAASSATTTISSYSTTPPMPSVPSRIMPPPRQPFTATKPTLRSRKPNNPKIVPRATTTTTIQKPTAAPFDDREGEKASKTSSALRAQIALAKAAAAKKQASLDVPESSSFSTSPVSLPPKIHTSIVSPSSASSYSTPFSSSPFSSSSSHLEETDWSKVEDPFRQKVWVDEDEVALQQRLVEARTSGRLNIAGLDLQTLPLDILKMYDLETIGEVGPSWAESVDLVRLSAANNGLLEISDVFFPTEETPYAVDEDDSGPVRIFAGLESMDLHGNALTAIPRGFSCLMNLTSLNLSQNNLTNDCLEIITQIPILRDLKLSNNQLVGPLTPSLLDLELLEVLDLHGNQISALPDNFDRLRRLRILNVAHNRLSSLPMESFTEMPLAELIAYKNNLSYTLFPDSVTSLPSIRVLDVSLNRLTHLINPNLSLQLPSLHQLIASSNRLQALPSLFGWASLTSLHVEENCLSAIPEGFASLTGLVSADFSGNDIRVLPAEISRMDRLTILRIVGNPLRDKKFISLALEDIKSVLAARLEPPPPYHEHAAQDPAAIDGTPPVVDGKNENKVAEPGVAPVDSVDKENMGSAVMSAGLGSDMASTAADAAILPAPQDGDDDHVTETSEIDHRNIVTQSYDSDDDGDGDTFATPPTSRPTSMTF